MALFHRMGHMVRDLVEGRKRFDDVLPTNVKIQVTMADDPVPYAAEFDVTESGAYFGRTPPKNEQTEAVQWG